MATEPRIGDTLIPVEMNRTFVVLEVDDFAREVKASGEGSLAPRTFNLDRLEEVDPGVWQETAQGKSWEF